ncbi:hypothetical protein [Rhizobium chutanense]|uniref:hypothetical protein n=1 Tax=Rhizobium chutanense TaxID=2035448 RepID=UPI00117A6933|nr:hypothetical protein [Rhizobium chutanense]
MTIPNGPHALMPAVEVKHHARRVEAANIAALITKGRDVNAIVLIEAVVDNRTSEYPLRRWKAADLIRTL